MERPYSKITVNAKAERLLRANHPWVYGEEITEITGDYKNGDVVDVFSQKGKWLGAGFINDNSKIRVRILSRNANNKFDREFWKRRLSYAVEYRKTVMGDDFSNCRLIFGESDGFPGLTIDRFEDILVSECQCYGTEQIKQQLFEDLVSILYDNGVKISAVYERNDALTRKKEGLELYCGYALGEGSGNVIITENGIKYNVDYINGQKTGFFLDQKYNRAAVAKIAKGKHVLDCFTHTGAFGLNCCKGGAAEVTSVDISDTAIESAKANAALNDLDVNYICCDVFDLLTELAEQKQNKYDFIILDPPAFTKSNSTVKNAIRGYKEINYKAMKLLPKGGYLATCSCSHFMTNELFKKMIQDAANDANVCLKQIEERQQGPDHPISWNVPETNYLKFYIFQVVGEM